MTRTSPSAPPGVDQVRTSPRKQHALALFAGLPRSYHSAGALMSFGQDPRWRRALVAAIRPGPEDRVLDVATGTGLVARELIRAGGCQVVGLDQSEEMLSRARELAARDPSLAARVRFVRGEAERLPFGDGQFDHLTFTYLLRYVDDPAATLRELARVLRPGGRLATLEFGVPGGPAYPLWWLYTRHPLAEQVRMWEDAGLRSVAVRRMSLGAGVVVSAIRDGARLPD